MVRSSMRNQKSPRFPAGLARVDGSARRGTKWRGPLLRGIHRSEVLRAWGSNWGGDLVLRKQRS